MNFSAIAEIVLKASRAEQTEVLAIEQNESLTRFANNSIHQNVTELNSHITVRSVIGAKVGIAVSNDVSPDGLKSLAARAAEVARLQPDNSEFKGLPLPRPLKIKAAFDEATAACPPDVRAARAASICQRASTTGCSAAGSVTTAEIQMGVANSRGVFVSAGSTLADATTVIMGSNSSGWSQRTGWSLEAVQPEAMAEEALAKVRLGVDPVDFDPGDYAVILDPYAVGNLLEMLAYDGMSALSFQEGRSWLNGRIGERIMGDGVTILDDAANPAGIPFPFDFEGVPKETVPIIKDGVALGPVHDSFTAGRENGKESTGHATPPSPYGRMGPMPMNLFLEPGTTSLEAMIRSTKLGLYVTRFWYTRTVHPRDAVVTGMTRDGTFVIRDGEIVRPAKSLRFTQSFLDALRWTEAIGTNRLVLRSGYGAVTVPALKLAKFTFTSSTR